MLTVTGEDCLSGTAVRKAYHFLEMQNQTISMVEKAPSVPATPRAK